MCRDSDALIEAEAVEDDFFAGDERRALAGEKTLDAIREGWKKP